MVRNLACTLVVLLVGVSTGCTEDRDRSYPGGVHPAGWADREADTFHGKDLEARSYPLDECRQCHGDTLTGGAVDVACSNGACHERGIDFCGTCHGDETGPLPATNGAHTTHQAYCARCHTVPTGIESHPDGTVDVLFTGLPTTGDFDPAWDTSSRTCGDVYCHQGDSPVWDDATKLDCDGCHATSVIHARFDNAVSVDTCANCHVGSPAVGHLDGTTLIEIDTCDACHGHGLLGAPPPALDGATDPTDPVVGAHQRHLDRFLSGRIGKVARCDACHVVPTAFDSPGHMDQAAPADVDTLGGSYDPNTQECTSWCHMNGTPVWTDNSGAARACDSCHAFPPVTTQGGAVHPPVPDPTIAKCQGCHGFTADTHVDGELTF